MRFAYELRPTCLGSREVLLRRNEREARTRGLRSETQSPGSREPADGFQFELGLNDNCTRGRRRRLSELRNARGLSPSHRVAARRLSLSLRTNGHHSRM